MTNSDLFRTVQEWAVSNYPGLVHKMRLIVELHDGSKTHLHVPLQPAARPPHVPGFRMTQCQAAILEALEGKILKTGALTRATGYTSAELFRERGGMHELQEHGMVAHVAGKGFYRPDAPPDDLEAE